ncbi:hypothetical protein DFJ77DRAFT_215641 [Powellomyces hirtus]|nr:hypothetical protein DFJ77DRAFT_215641 [Powellomyces hirtus]
MLTDPHMQLDFYELDLPFVVYGRHNFVAEEEDEITFAAADPVVVLERDELYSDGWWRGRNRQGHVGLFPKNFIAFDPPSKTSPPQPKQTSADHLPSPALSQHYVFPNPPVSDEVDSVAGTLQRQSLSFTPGTPPEISKDLANLEDRYSTLSRTPAAAPNAHPKTWNPRDVENWLSREGFEFAIRYFKQTPITGQALLDLNLSSLRELGMESLSDRINILHQILALKEDFPDLPTPESARESPQVSRTCPTGSSHQTVQGTPSPARESLATSSHGPAAVASLRGSVLGSSSASGSRPPSPPATCLEKNRDQKEGSAGNARSQDSGFVEQAEEDLGKPQYPIRQDSWGQGAISPIIAPNDLPPPEQQRRLRKPASDFTLSDYFYGSETGGDDQDRDGEEEEDYHLTLPPLELPTGKHTSVENKDGEATLVRSPDRANRVGGMVGVTGSPLMEEQTVNEGRGQE